MPYIRNVSEKFMKIFNNHGVTVCHKPTNKLRNFLVHPKDEVEDLNRCGVIYLGKCNTCDKEYIGETARSMKIRINEHLHKKEQPTAIKEHLAISKHHMETKSFSILSGEPIKYNRKVKEAIKIKKLKPDLNRDDSFDLEAIYNDILSRDHSPTDGHVTASS